MPPTSPDKKQSSPHPSSEAAQNRMKAVRQKGTAAELLVREVLDTYGLVYETNSQPLPKLRRFADILFREEKIAVFIDGCFWHGCPTHGTQSKSNARFWAEKIARNKERDRDTDRQLREAGWTVVRKWEHEDPTAVAKSIWTELQKRNQHPEK